MLEVLMGKYITDSESEIRDLIIDIGKRLWERGYIIAKEGNISIRIDDGEILITPMGVSKGFMSRDMIIKINMDGEVISPNKDYCPSSEVKMHLEAYKQRDDVKAVIHAHPPYSTSFAVAGVPIDTSVLPEAIMSLGEVPIAPYGTPSTSEVPDSIKPFIRNSDAILLANHGALTLGTDLITAYDMMETLEHTARILYLAAGLGYVNKIPEEQINKLMKIRGKTGSPVGENISSAGTGLNRPSAAQARKIRSRKGLLR
jgi:L-fuculose-phosphate aldolase